MKRLTLIFVLLLTASIPMRAQKYACVNTDYIFRNVPEYNQAINKINKFIEEWTKELQAKQLEIDELRQLFEQEAYLLPDNLKQRRQDELHSKETELRDLQHQRFSTGGDLDKKRAELMKPVQDRIYNAIERVAHEKNYAFVFDKAASNTILYVGEKYDISNQVLEMLGVKPGATADNASVSSDTKGGNKPNGNNTSNGEKSALKHVRQ